MRTGQWWVPIGAVVLLLCLAVAANAQTSLIPNGGFESGKPSFWTAEAGTSGAVLTWATDQVKGGTHSLKIVKAQTGAMARWISANNVRYWVENISKGVDIKVGAWVKTSGVNTNPTDDNGRWQIKAWFYDTTGALIGGVPFALNVDQSAASRDWYADTNGVASLNLPVDAYKMKMSAEAGPNATGTVWFDTFIFIGRAGAWAGQNWDGFVDVDQGWQYWIGPNGGNDGLSDFGGTGVTTEDKHLGNYSLKIVGNVGRDQNEAVVFTETIPIPANSKGKQYVVSAWVKANGMDIAQLADPQYAIGFTWTWHNKMWEDGNGWNEVGGGDYMFGITDSTTNGWRQYSAILTVPDSTVQAVSLRARAEHKWTGISYWDDFDLSEMKAVITGVGPEGSDGIATVMPTAFRIHQNYPNPFNPTTKIVYDIPMRAQVSLRVYNIIGQEIATLVEGTLAPGRYTAVFDASHLPSGMYFTVLRSGATVIPTKMLFVK